LRIIVAKTAGFCFGVDRAVNLVYQMLEDGKNVSTLGPIIHNPQLTGDLENRGVKSIESPEESSANDTVVVRTHGVPKDLLKTFEESGANLCDATCPYVKKIHNIVSKNSSAEIPTLIAGDENHPEVKGIISYCKGKVYVFENREALTKLFEDNPTLKQKKLLVVAQTTFSIEEWDRCVKQIKSLCTNAIIFDTICSATHDRQNEAYMISKEADIMIVIGGRDSSNTAKLKSVCEQNCKTYHIETAAELKDIDFSGSQTIGVTAGASTPAGIIKEVLETMTENLNNDLVEQEENTVQEMAQETAAVSEVNADAVEAQAAETEEVVTETEPKEEVSAQEDSMSAEERSFTEVLEENLQKMSTDQKVVGVVMGITPTEIQVDIGRKHAGFISWSEYSADPNCDPRKELKVGDELDLIIMKTDDAMGTVELSKVRCDAMKAWFDVEDAVGTDTIFEGVVTDIIKGGLLANTSGVRVFIPRSLATPTRNESVEDLLHKAVKFRIIEVNKQRKRAVGSIRAVLKDGYNEAADAFWTQAEVGQVYQGKVKSMTNYGAFIDIGGVDGMAHISELSWSRIKHPSDVLNVGDEVEVYIKGLDPETRRISLGYKKAEDNPWEILRRDYPVDSSLEVEIVGMTTFGAFARVIPGVDGLIHISQIANRHIEKPQDELKIGEKVTVKITAIDFDKHRVSLSIRALLDPMEGEEEVATEEAVAEEVPAVEAVAEEAPAEEAAAEENPTEKTVAEETPVEEAVAGEAPAAEAAAEDAPAEVAVAEEAPVEDAE